MDAKVPSPSLFNKIGSAFRRAVMSFATENMVPVIRFAKGDRRAEVMRPFLALATEPGVVAIGMAQEFQSVFSGYDRNADQPGPPRYSFAKADRRVTTFYFYIWDDEFTLTDRVTVDEHPPIGVDPDSGELCGLQGVPPGAHRQRGRVEVDGPSRVAGLASSLVEFVADGDEPRG